MNAKQVNACFTHISSCLHCKYEEKFNMILKRFLTEEQ